MTVRLVPAPEVDVAAVAPSVRADRLASYLWQLGVSVARIEAEAYGTADQATREVYKRRPPSAPRPTTEGGTR